MGALTLFNRYYGIAFSSKSSHRIVLDHDHSQEKGPKALSLWGRFVQACKDLLKSKETLTANKAAVLSNFEKALNQRYSCEATRAAQIELDNLKGAKKSLRARDVRNIINIVANNASKHKTEAGLLKAADEAIRPAQIIEHKKTVKSDYVQYYFDKKFTPRTRHAEARLITKRKEPRLATDFLDSDPGANDNKITETKLADKYVCYEEQDNPDAHQLLSEIGVDIDTFPIETLRNHFIAVYNSIVDNATEMSKSKISIRPEDRILQQQELLKAMIEDPSLASKILDYFDKITDILEIMRDEANNDESQLFARNFMKLICTHNGFAKSNGLDKISNFDQMLTIASHVGLSRLAADHRRYDVAFTKLASVLSLNIDIFTSELRSNEENLSGKQGIIASENFYGAYQHIPKSMDRIEYSRCPINFPELSDVAKKFLPAEIPEISEFENIDWKSAIYEGINGYMQSELDVRLT